MRELTEKEILNRKHFLMFMELIGLSPTSCNAYATTLMSCSDFIKDELEKDGYASLYEVDNQKDIKRYQQILDTTPAYISRNHSGNNRHLASIVNYVKFIDFLFIFKRDNISVFYICYSLEKIKIWQKKIK